VGKDLLAAKGTAVIDVFLLAGIFAAVLLADKISHVRLQVIGFIGCAAGLFIAAQSAAFEGPTRLALIFVGFMLFNFMTNLGPNAQSYLIAGEVFPTAVRGKGAGFAASFAKIGGCLTAFLFPSVLADFGITLLLSVLVGTSLLGALVTWMFRIETMGIDLETVGAEPSRASARALAK
jgi:putative MFS transporter